MGAFQGIEPIAMRSFPFVCLRGGHRGANQLCNHLSKRLERKSEVDLFTPRTDGNEMCFSLIK